MPLRIASAASCWIIRWYVSISKPAKNFLELVQTCTSLHKLAQAAKGRKAKARASSSYFFESNNFVTCTTSCRKLKSIKRSCIDESHSAPGAGLFSNPSSTLPSKVGQESLAHCASAVTTLEDKQKSCSGCCPSPHHNYGMCWWQGLSHGHGWGLTHHLSCLLRFLVLWPQQFCTCGLHLWSDVCCMNFCKQVNNTSVEKNFLNMEFISKNACCPFCSFCTCIAFWLSCNFLTSWKVPESEKVFLPICWC